MLGVKEKERVRAFLGEGTAFKGQLNVEGTVRLDGKLEGELITKDNLNATGKIEIPAGAEGYGNIRTSLLKIEEGAIFVGKCEVLREGGKPLRIPSIAASDKEGEGQGQLVLYPPLAEKRAL